MPQLLGAAIGLWWFWGLLLKAERRDRRDQRAAPAAGRPPSWPTKFWRFTAPRGMAGIFQIVVLWLNTLLVGRLDSTSRPASSTPPPATSPPASWSGWPIQQVAGPKLSELMAQRNWDRARGVYQTTTGWLMVATWPLYLTFALFAPTLLRLFGKGFERRERAPSRCWASRCWWPPPSGPSTWCS